jgi:hypothetical protein
MSIPTETPTSDVFAPKAGTIPRASRAAVTDRLVMAGAMRLHFRPIGSDDRDALAELFTRLTAESLRRPFLSAKPESTSRELVLLTALDRVWPASPDTCVWLIEPRWRT